MIVESHKDFMTDEVGRVVCDIVVRVVSESSNIETWINEALNEENRLSPASTMRGPGRWNRSFHSYARNSNGVRIHTRHVHEH